jgi:hypothetical protein
VVSLAGEPVKAWLGDAVAAGGRPGQVLAADAEGIVVACGEGALRLTELQKPGGRRVASADFLSGSASATGLSRNRVFACAESGRGMNRAGIHSVDATAAPARRDPARGGRPDRRRDRRPQLRCGAGARRPGRPIRAAAMDLAYSTLRAFGRGDFLLGQLLGRPLKDAIGARPAAGVAGAARERGRTTAIPRWTRP